MSQGVLSEVQVDGDDYDRLLTAIEKSFGIRFEQKLYHLRTVGELFDEILKRAQPGGSGDTPGSTIVLQRLQPMLIRVGLDPAAGPETALASQNLPSPRRIARMIRRELGFEPPKPVTGSFVGIAGPALVLGGIALAWWLGSLWPFGLWLLVYPLVVLDPGGWTRDWATLGSLTEAVAARNGTALAALGARSDEGEWWRQLATMFCSVANDQGTPITDFRLIDRSTRFSYS
jgi:hypothetical protein